MRQEFWVPCCKYEGLSWRWLNPIDQAEMTVEPVRRWATQHRRTGPGEMLLRLSS